MRKIMIVIVAATICAIIEAEDFTVFPISGTSSTVLKGEGKYFSVNFGGWGPNWSWLGFSKSQAKASEDACIMTTEDKVAQGGALVKWNVKVQHPSASQLSYQITLSSDKDTAITSMIAALSVDGDEFAKSSAELKYSDGSSKTFEHPWARKLQDVEAKGKVTESMTLTDVKGGKSVFRFSPAVKVVSDGDIRIILAEERLDAAKPVNLKMTVDLPGTAKFYGGMTEVPQAPGFESWYPFNPGADHAIPSAIGMADWLEKPAGNHGRIAMKNEKLLYNGKEIKIWGLNLCYGSCAPKKELADQEADLYAKYGINSVRFHKYADGPGWAGILSNNSVLEFDPEKLDQMDYFVSKLKEKGIYIKLSSNFTLKIGPGDRKAVPYFDEFVNYGKDWKATEHGSIFIARELQDLQIMQLVNLLKHKNPYTGLTYAEDPSIWCVEMFNEDDALFGGITNQMKRPTLRKRAGELFSAWLQVKYGSKEALLKAWGDKALDSFGYENLTGEKWEDKTIIPVGSPWYFDQEQLEGSQKFRKQRLLDTMQFLYGLQNEFYTRYRQAICDAGYGGITLASNWQAGSGASHYYNLHTDYQFGLIDRHNYYGGGSSNFINNDTMLRIPGSGMLSSGMQQVADRPFMLSEWIHVNPNEWSVEGPAIIGAYAMGLQGWDASYIFQNRDEGKIRNFFKDQWQVDKPTVLGIFPFVARQVMRGDVKESSLLIPRYVHIPSLAEGKLGFSDKATQQNDFKTFDSYKIPGKALAVGRCVVEFTDQYKDTQPFDISKYVKDGVYSSSTGQLQWHEGKTRVDGFFTIDSAGTKAVIGFAKGEKCVLGDVSIAPESRFGAIYITAAEKDKDIAGSNRLLIAAIARVRQANSKIFADTFILDRGTEQFVMEPVKASIVLKKPGNATLIVLDHNGFRTQKRVQVKDGAIAIDTSREQTPYYEIVYGPVSDEFQAITEKEKKGN
jgi:hypothetical protein